MKRLLLSLVGVLMIPAMSFAQKPWNQAGAFPSADFPKMTNAKVNWDGHGVAVDPDGKVWYQPYYATDSTSVNWQAKKIATRVIYVFNPDGTQASFSPIKYIDLPGGARDTLGGVTVQNATTKVKSFSANSGCGLRVDHQGNILVSAFNTIYRLDYKTGAGMNRLVTATTRASNTAITAPAVDANGNIFVATVTPGVDAVKMYDKDFNFLGNAIDKAKVKGYSRSFLVSPDGNTIYWAGYTNHGVIMYQRPDEFSAFDSVGVVLAGLDTESLTFHPVTGHLWASAGSQNDLPNRYPNVVTKWKKQTWYSFNAATLTPKNLTDAETPIESLQWQPYVAADTVGRPRGLGFTADGKTAYAVTFSSGTAKDANNVSFALPTLQKFTAPAASSRNITLTLNMAASPDTVGVKRRIQVRGDNEGSDLPGGTKITWGDDTSVKMTNIGGDYWKVQFNINENKDLNYKFWSSGNGDDKLGNLVNGGWEDGDNHKIDKGTGDVTRALHFFNQSGGNRAYDYKPFRTVGTDSVAVWFRIFMNTEGAVKAGVDYNRETAVVGLRGDNLGGAGAIDWGSTKVKLKPESTDKAKPTYHVFSGMAVYPKTLSGREQCFKYFVEPSGWEDVVGGGGCSTDGGNRTFKVPKADSTIMWVKFGNTKDAPNETPVTKNMTFSVDLTPLQDIGIFDRTRGDSLQVRGDFNGWGCDNTKFEKCLLDKVPGAPQYELTFPFKGFPNAELQYKYYLDFNNVEFKKTFAWVPSGWEEPITTTGANRKSIFLGTADQTLPTAYFNDIERRNIIPQGTNVSVKFKVNMTPALTGVKPFNPATDSVFVDLTGDPIWGLSQGYAERKPGDGVAGLDYKFILTDADKDMVYEGALALKAPTYGALQYKYSYGTKASTTTEDGGATSGLGRRRTRFVQCTYNPVGTCVSWPAVQQFPQETYQQSGNLPYEENRVDVDPVDTPQLPTTISLSQNYPNPFNPSTTFEYTLDRDAKVKVQVYDLTGRLIETLVDGFQTQNTYRVSFDASRLASGTYLYRLQVGNQVVTRKMTFLK